MNIVKIEGEVSAVDRHSLYGATHKYHLYFQVTGNITHLVPFNVFCVPCQQMCAIDMVQKPGHVKFWCTGQFDIKSPSCPGATRRCGFSITFSNPS